MQGTILPSVINTCASMSKHCQCPRTAHCPRQREPQSAQPPPIVPPDGNRGLHESMSGSRCEYVDSMCIYIYIYVYIHISIYIYIYISLSGLCIYVYIYIYVFPLDVYYVNDLYMRCSKKKLDSPIEFMYKAVLYVYMCTCVFVFLCVL